MSIHGDDPHELTSDSIHFDSMGSWPRDGHWIAFTRKVQDFADRWRLLYEFLMRGRPILTPI